MNKKMYAIAKSLGLEKKDVDGALSGAVSSPRNDNVSADVYKAGTEYGTVSSKDLYKAGTYYGTVSSKDLYKAGTYYGTISVKDF